MKHILPQRYICCFIAITRICIIVTLFTFAVAHHAIGKDSATIPTDKIRNAITKSNIPQNIKTALQEFVDKNPHGSGISNYPSWACESDNFAGVVAAVKYEERSKLTSISSAQARCFAALTLLAIKEGTYTNIGLDDKDLLKSALLQSEGLIALVGNVKGMLHETITVDHWVVTVGYCPLKSVAAELLKPKTITQVRNNYSNGGLSRLLLAKNKQNWTLAKKTWEHLKKQKLLSAQIAVEYGDCLLQQGETHQALEHFEEYLDGYDHILDKEFFLQIVDLLEPIANEQKQAERIALRAYDKFEQIQFRQPRTIQVPSAINKDRKRNVQ